MSSDKIGYNFDEEGLPPSFNDLMFSCTLAQKKAMLVALSNSIKRDVEKRTKRNIDFNQYVEVVKDFLPSDYFDEAIKAEVTELGLLKKADKPQTQWLSCDSREYCFSDNAKLKHPAKNIKQFPAICKLMEQVNSDSRTTQNADSALVIVYNSMYAGIDFHNDGEKLIDSNSSISTVTFGSTRDIDFCNHALRPRVAQHTLQCDNHDLMIMKPGCQENLVHRVCQGKTFDIANDDWRIVISFRKLSPEVVQDPEISFDNRTSNPVTAEKDKPTPPTRVTIIAGDSFSAALDAERLGRKGRKNVVNLSKGDATIKDVSLQLDCYFLSNSYGNVVVEKIFVCVGTNDIRNCRENGVRHLKSPLVSLAEQIKMSFPDAAVWFQCIVPLPLQHQYSVRNVEQYNTMLFEVCSYMKIFYLDIFKNFLVFNLRRGCFYRRESLFVDQHNIHFNRFGLGILARNYIHLIHSIVGGGNYGQ